MVDGKRVDCIIGHTRIRNFSTATEVLQGKVMTFVNQLAEIVHGVVDSHGGAANQNNGNTFLLVWRMTGISSQKAGKLGDMAVLAFAKILGAIHRSPLLAEYRAHPGLQQRLGSNHKVTMSVGLHAGWAIEGAVGSEFKIDASYLSPNVKLADSLERATKEYNVSFLTSQAVIRLCSKKVASNTRLIDKVMLGEFRQPLDLYTLDLDTENVRIDLPWQRSFHWPNVRERFKARQFLEAEKQQKFALDYDIAGETAVQKDIIEMREIYTKEFLCLFNRGYQNYTQGEWTVAKRVFSQTHTMLGVKDGPSGALLNFMEANASAFNFAPPEGWNGVRTITLSQDPDL
jgi:class 3 adenylate cyclase